MRFFVSARAARPGGGNVLLRDSQLAVTAWTAINRVFTKSGEASLVDHYKQVYAPGSPTLAQMKAEFAKLGAYARERDPRVTLAMVPDIHSLTDYPLGLCTTSLRASRATTVLPISICCRRFGG